MIGKILLQYEIETLTGKVNFGEIYTGINTATHQKVSIRRIDQQLISANIENQIRIKNDLYILSQLSNPVMAAVYQYVLDGNSLFCISEFVEGMPINKHLEKLSAARSAKVSVFETPFINQIVEALNAVHAKGVCHGHLRPDNILVTKNGDLKIMNFGFAPLSELDRNAANTGIIAYLSPEQIQNRPTDTRSDIYTFGVILFKLITGQTPYQSMLSDDEVARKISNEPFPLTLLNTAGILDKYISLIKKATEIYPENRIRIEQMKAELQAINDTAPVVEKPKPQPEQAKPYVMPQPEIVGKKYRYEVPKDLFFPY